MTSASLLLAESDCDPRDLDAAYKVFRRKSGSVVTVWSPTERQRIQRMVGVPETPHFKVKVGSRETYWTKRGGAYRPIMRGTK